MLKRALGLSLAMLAPTGCDTLFPELDSTSKVDASTSDALDAGTGTLVGKVCLLTDVRAPSSCTSAAPGRHITIEETRASTDVLADGSFSISLTGITSVATIAVSDGATTLGQSAPTITRLSGSLLTAARTSGIELPVVPLSDISNMALENGTTEDTSHGGLVTWALDGSGIAVAGVQAARIGDSTGPLYDVNGTSTLITSNHTGAYGAIGYLELPIGDLMLTLTAPASADVDGDTFTLPIRAGAITVSVLALPAR